LDGAVTPLRLKLPAYAELSDEHGSALRYLLLPDRGIAPVAAYGAVLTGMLRAQAKLNRTLPALLIATETEDRAATWRQELEDRRWALGVAGVPLCAATWDALETGAARLPPDVSVGEWRGYGTDGTDEPLAAHASHDRIPALVGRPGARDSLG